MPGFRCLGLSRCPERPGAYLFLGERGLWRIMPGASVVLLLTRTGARYFITSMSPSPLVERFEQINNTWLEPGAPGFFVVDSKNAKPSTTKKPDTRHCVHHRSAGRSRGALAHHDRRKEHGTSGTECGARRRAGTDPGTGPRPYLMGTQSRPATGTPFDDPPGVEMGGRPSPLMRCRATNPRIRGVTGVANHRVPTTWMPPSGKAGTPGANGR